MNKAELLTQLESAQEQLKDYNKFIDLFKEKDDPKYVLTKLNQTISRIKMLLKAQNIKELVHPANQSLKKPLMAKQGCLVRIRPSDEEYGNKTYLGFLLGDLATGSSLSVLEDKLQLNWSGHNSAIFVPELGEIIYGCESWWGEIEDEDQLKEISDNDIENVWYVKLLRQMNKKEDTSEI
jgi:hypothetical protein